MIFHLEINPGLSHFYAALRLRIETRKGCCYHFWRRDRGTQGYPSPPYRHLPETKNGPQARFPSVVFKFFTLSTSNYFRHLSRSP